MDNEGLITLTKCDNTIVADEIIAKLASNGITASLHDELNDPAYGAYGPNPGIAVRVFKKDYEQSLRILKGIRTSRSEQLPWCPRCGSDKIKVVQKEVDKKSTPTILLGIVLIILGCAGLILPNFVKALASVRLYGFIISPFILLGGVLLVSPKQDGKYYECTECGKVFKKKSSKKERSCLTWAMPMQQQPSPWSSSDSYVIISTKMKLTLTMTKA